MQIGKYMIIVRLSDPYNYNDYLLVVNVLKKSNDIAKQIPNFPFPPEKNQTTNSTNSTDSNNTNAGNGTSINVTLI